jgi:hypothetical protein
MAGGVILPRGLPIDIDFIIDEHDVVSGLADEIFRVDMALLFRVIARVIFGHWGAWLLLTRAPNHRSAPCPGIHHAVTHSGRARRLSFHFPSA